MADELRGQRMEQLRHLIKDYPVAILTTASPGRRLRSRPMMWHPRRTDPNLWFATRYDTDKVHDIERDPCVGVTFYRPRELFYVSVSGTGEIVTDPALVRELWDPSWTEWFPQGPDDPTLALVKVSPIHVEYWDERSGRVNVLFTGREGGLQGERAVKAGQERRLGESHARRPKSRQQSGE